MVSAPFEHREGCGTHILEVTGRNQNEPKQNERVRHPSAPSNTAKDAAPTFQKLQAETKMNQTKMKWCATRPAPIVPICVPTSEHRTFPV